MQKLTPKAFDAVYDTVLAATDAASADLAAVHLWEFGDDETEAFENPEVHRKEVDMLLDTMANAPGARYDDADGFATRNVAAHKEGCLGLACTALVKEVPQVLFGVRSKTGLLLLNPTPVFALYSDAFTLTYDEQSSMLKQLLGVTSTKRLLLFDLERNDVNLMPGGLNRELLRIQGFDERTIKDLWGSVDMLSPKVHASAREAVQYLKQHSKAAKKEMPGLANEVDVNAHARHVAGILAYVPQGELDLRSQSWQDRLAANPALGELLNQALDDYAQVRGKLDAHGHAQPITIVIYQSQAKHADDRFVHFAPTQQNIALVRHTRESSHAQEEAARAQQPRPPYER